MKIILAVIGLLVVSRVLASGASPSSLGSGGDSGADKTTRELLKHPHLAPVREAIHGRIHKGGFLHPVVHGLGVGTGATGSDSSYGFVARTGLRFFR